ncbi:hypothetical protein [Crateriforma spongiae]|uniref:hypothetical protein n=1 Tax=Crateriforma spongiae TaxID=2724528 RepID=UPI001F19B2BB|nr:hypothetical protein [Crateriforma spongiae]
MSSDLSSAPAFRNARPAPVWTAVVLAMAVCSVGCAVHRPDMATARSAFAAGDLGAADATLREIADSRSKESDAAALDLAIVELASGDSLAAEQRLRKLRDQFDSRPLLTPLADTASMVTDDRTRIYRSSGYEQVMIRSMLALCSLSRDAADAEAYTLQAQMKQQELAKHAEERGLMETVAEAGTQAYQPMAMTSYLRGVLREATHRDYDDATKAYQLVSQIRPDFRPAHEDIARASGGTHSRPGHGVIYVLACVGRGPVLVEQEAETTTTAMNIASALLSNVSNDEDSEEDDDDRQVILGNIASVKIPVVAIPDSPTAALATTIDGQVYGATQTLTDVADLAIRQNEIERPWTIARAVMRRVTKESMVATAGRQLGLSGTPGKLFHLAAASAWSASESADTRCWGLLPREVQVLRAELPTGSHAVTLTPLGFDGGEIGTPVQTSVSIEDGRNHYLIAIAPGRHVFLAGEPTP